MSKRDAKNTQDFITSKNLTIFTGKTRGQNNQVEPSTSKEPEDKSEYDSISESFGDKTIGDEIDPLDTSAFNRGKLINRSPIQIKTTPPEKPKTTLKPPSTPPPPLPQRPQVKQENNVRKEMDASSEGYAAAVEKYAKAETTDSARIKIVTELADTAYEQFLNDVIAHRDCQQELRLKIIKKIINISRANNENTTEVPNRRRIAEFTTKNLSKFHGDENENFNEWLSKITIAIGTHGFDDNEALLAVASQVAGTAFNWYETYISNTNDPKRSEFKNN